MMHKLKSVYKKYIFPTIYNFVGGGNKFVIKGKRNSIFHQGNYLKKCKISVFGNDNKILFVKCGRNRLISTNIYINGNNNEIVIGKNNVFINGDIYIEDDNNKVVFGSGNSVCGYTHIAVIEGQSVIFGDGCLFSTDVTFRVGDSHSIMDNNTGKRINPSKSIKIGDRVWFGNKTTILKGIEIGNDSIIATGSVVTKSFVDGNVIIAGNPGKIIKTDIKWTNERL